MAVYPQSITTGSTIFESAGYPTYPGGGYHGGIDTVHNDLLAYSPQAGTVVVAHTWDGHTTDPGSVESWGNYVVVQFGPNQYYLAAHFTQQTHHVGEEIAKGAYLGRQGETGNATGIHTHWEYWNGGQSTRYRDDPSKILGIPNGRGTYDVSWDAEEPGPGPGARAWPWAWAWADVGENPSVAAIQNGRERRAWVMAAPYSYTEINTLTSPVTPNVMRTGGNALSYYFRKYLFLEAISVFKWTVPETWPDNRLQYLIFGKGCVTVFNTSRFGLVYDYAAPYGFNVFYQPTHFTVANPCIPRSVTLQIGRNCELIQMKPDYTGIADVCAFYGDLLALTCQTMQANLINSRLSYVFAASNKAGAEAFKKMFDNILQGDPAVFVDKELANSLDKTKGSSWQSFAGDLKQSFIVPDLISSWRRVKEMFDTEIGIPNTNSDKKERMTSQEINSNSVETVAKAGLWLDYMQRGCEKVHKMFGLDKSQLWVDWRTPPDAMQEATDATPAGRPRLEVMERAS